MNEATVRVLIVDDHAIVREGARSLLAAMRPEWTVSEASDGKQARECIRKIEPDLVVMDITMPDASGLEVTADLRKAGYHRPILMFTMHSSARLAIEAQDAGAQGFVLKSQAISDLVKAIEILLAGGTFYGAVSSSLKSEKEPSSGGFFFVWLTPQLAT
jgi:DNA-binding NarL/FixJ family response regulator